MNATQVIQEIEHLPAEEQEAVLAYVSKRFALRPATDGLHHRLMSFEEAADRVFRENHDLFRRLAQ